MPFYHCVREDTTRKQQLAIRKMALSRHEICQELYLGLLSL